MLDACTRHPARQVLYRCQSLDEGLCVLPRLTGETHRRFLDAEPTLS